MKIEDILVCINNYNCNENANKLKQEFIKSGFYTIIIDSGSDLQEESFDIKLGNVYYNGLLNQSIESTISFDKQYMFFIASDVLIEDIDKLKLYITNLSSDIYLYSPSSKGQSHPWCKNRNTNDLRDVIFIEGFIFLSHINILKTIYPINLDVNRLGYGLDILLGYKSYKTFNKRCVIDDRFTVYHKEGTGYNTNRATIEMNNWIKKLSVEEQNFINLYLTNGYNIESKLLNILKS